MASPSKTWEQSLLEQRTDNQEPEGLLAKQKVISAREPSTPLRDAQVVPQQSLTRSDGFVALHPLETRRQVPEHGNGLLRKRRDRETRP